MSRRGDGRRHAARIHGSAPGRALRREHALRILLIHDDAAQPGQLAARLEGLGHVVSGTPSSGTQAIEMANSAAADLLLVDMAVEGAIHGVAAADVIRRHRPVPVVFIGAGTTEDTLVAAGMARPFGVLEPPFSDRELRLTLELAWERFNATRAVHELEAFFAISNDMFCFLGFDGRFRHLNPAWERTLGFTLEELMSRPFIEFVHPDDRERTLAQNARVRGGGRATGFENRYLCKDGSHRWFLWNAVPETAVRTIYSVARDITTRKLAEAERVALVAELEASLAEVSALQEILPICSYCRKVRDDEDFWHSVEHYIAQHTKTRFSHGICPECMATHVEPHLQRAEAARPGNLKS